MVDGDCLGGGAHAIGDREGTVDDAAAQLGRLRTSSSRPSAFVRSTLISAPTRSTPMTRCPSSLSLRAVALPRPVAEPVTTYVRVIGEILHAEGAFRSVTYEPQTGAAKTARARFVGTEGVGSTLEPRREHDSDFVRFRRPPSYFLARPDAPAPACRLRQQPARTLAA
ncbi:hypothetical protein ACFPRL_09165 [Pseudoclavibacter helvolus]